MLRGAPPHRHSAGHVDRADRERHFTALMQHGVATDDTRKLRTVSERDQCQGPIPDYGSGIQAADLNVEEVSGQAFARRTFRTSSGSPLYWTSAHTL